MELASVAAVAENGVVGRDGELPWPSIPEDKRQYRRRVADDPVVLGRRTFESMLDDLPGAHQIVLSRSDREFDVETVSHAGSVEAAIAIAESLDAERAYVLGGAAIYELFQPHLDRMYLSRVDGSYDGDSYYPEWDETEWTIVDRTGYDRFTLEEWQRID